MFATIVKETSKDTEENLLIKVLKQKDSCSLEWYRLSYPWNTSTELCYVFATIFSFYAFRSLSRINDWLFIRFAMKVFFKLFNFVQNMLMFFKKFLILFHLFLSSFVQLLRKNKTDDQSHHVKNLFFIAAQLFKSNWACKSPIPMTSIFILLSLQVTLTAISEFKL